MDEKSRLRQLWLRVLLAAGILWGIQPFITLPFIVRGTDDSSLEVWAAVLNGLTIFPASLLAFWHRRVACIWLTINGAVVLISISIFISRTREHPIPVSSLVGVGVSVMFALLLVLIEVGRWPDALKGHAHSGKKRAGRVADSPPPA
jgi:hypothetical protein